MESPGNHAEGGHDIFLYMSSGSSFPINSRVSVHISRVSSVGLLGRVQDGPRAIIRQREISWNDPVPLEHYLNQVRQAVVLHHDAQRDRLEVSLRFAERDPWKNAAEKYAPGRELTGHVVGLIEGAAFVELEPGVDALLPLSELPTGSACKIEDLLWISDAVRAMSLEVLPEQRRLRISVKALLEQRERFIRRQQWKSQFAPLAEGVTLAEYLPKDIRLDLLRIGIEKRVGSEKELRVLVIEDDEVFAAGTYSLLLYNGCRVDLATDGVTGLAHIETSPVPYDLIIVDRNLPKLNGYEVIKQIMQRGQMPPIILALDPFPYEEEIEAANFIHESDVVILSKSDADKFKTRIISTLREIRQIRKKSNEASGPVFPDLPGTARELSSDEPLQKTPLAVQSEQVRILNILDQLKDDTQSTTVALLQLDRGHPRPVVRSLVGESFSLADAAPDVMYSPLQDVLEKGQEVWMDATSGFQRLQRLSALITFEGLLGIPIMVDETIGYGLFLFRQDKKYNHRHYQRTRIAAQTLAGVLQESRLFQVFQPWQSQNLLGQLSSSIIHEINNKLGGLTLLIQHLDEGLKELSRWPEKSEDASFLKSMEFALQGIANAQKEASELRDWYLGLTSADDLQAIHLNKVVKELTKALRGQAQEKNIQVEFRGSQQRLVVNARANQLQQVFLNIMLNAIQQMGEISRSGVVTVEMDYAAGTDFPIQIRFRDQGPGIHQHLWEYIFNFGYTTKKGGAGLGLAISREIINSLGGRIRVESSHMFWGSSMLVELPEGA